LQHCVLQSLFDPFSSELFLRNLLRQLGSNFIALYALLSEKHIPALCGILSGKTQSDGNFAVGRNAVHFAKVLEHSTSTTSTPAVCVTVTSG